MDPNKSKKFNEFIIIVNNLTCSDIKNGEIRMQGRIQDFSRGGAKFNACDKKSLFLVIREKCSALIFMFLKPVFRLL